ncbi:hypothetical protein EYC80_002707 [Monilinia laxa]|uniref:Uncharacterized protein n=1 Tax=Monilinia laxa TaxID=61186 RepID=A0A5N6K4U3_MONLA|nr:hypothetical protein EYC80_002707 [Monilinia laxa]
MEFSLENRQGPYFGFKNMEAYLRSKFACTIPLPKRPRLYRAPGYAPISSPSAPPVTVYRRRSRYLKMVLSFDDSYIFKLKDSSLIGYLVFLRGEYLQLKNAIRTVALKLSQDARDSSFAETRRRHELSRGFDVEDDAMFIPNLLSEEERSYGRLARAIAMRAIPFTPYNPHSKRPTYSELSLTQVALVHEPMQITQEFICQETDAEEHGERKIILVFLSCILTMHWRLYIL